FGPIRQLMLAERILGPDGPNPTAPGARSLSILGRLITAHAVPFAHFVIGTAAPFAEQNVASLGEKDKALRCFLVIGMMIGVAAECGLPVGTANILATGVRGYLKQGIQIELAQAGAEG